jgi:hypothetical protein
MKRLSVGRRSNIVLDRNAKGILYIFFTYVQDMIYHKYKEKKKTYHIFFQGC